MSKRASRLRFFEESPGRWRLRERRESDTTAGTQDVPPDKWVRLTYPPLSQYAPEDWPEVVDRPVDVGDAYMMGAVIGSGDTTRTVYDPSDKRKPYRFKEGTKKGQKAEIRRVMEERFQRDNKAPWPVDVDIAYD